MTDRVSTESSTATPCGLGRALRTRPSQRDTVPWAGGRRRAGERNASRTRAFEQPRPQGTGRAPLEGFPIEHVVEADEPGRERVPRGAEERRRIALLPHPTAVEHEEGVRDREREGRVVRDEHDRDPFDLPEVVEHEAELVAGEDIEALPRFVPHDEPGVGGDRSGERDALLLSSAQTGRATVRDRLELKALEEFARSSLGVRSVP